MESDNNGLLDKEHETPVLDVVGYRPVDQSDSPNRPECEKYRPEEVSDYSPYADPYRAHTVYRITKDSCEEMGVDPEMGNRIEAGHSGESAGAKTDV